MMMMVMGGDDDGNGDGDDGDGDDGDDEDYDDGDDNDYDDDNDDVDGDDDDDLILLLCLLYLFILSIGRIFLPQTGPSFSWQNDTLSVLWDVFPSLELDTVKYTSGPVVDAARRVLHRAGIPLQGLTSD